MKLSEVRALIDALCDDLEPTRGQLLDWHATREHKRSALAQAFESGVRSPGLRFQKTAAIMKACGVQVAEEPAAPKRKR